MRLLAPAVGFEVRTGSSYLPVPLAFTQQPSVAVIGGFVPPIVQIETRLGVTAALISDGDVAGDAPAPWPHQDGFIAIPNDFHRQWASTSTMCC